MEEMKQVGELTNFPVELKKFNWGAFFTSWIWGICNNVRVALWGLIGIFAGIKGLGIIFSIAVFIFQIWLGINGNRLAWTCKKWDSIEHFNSVQRKWAMWSAIIIFGIPFILGFIKGFAEGFSKAFGG